MKLGLSFLTYIRHSLIDFNKGLMASYLGRKWKVEHPGKEKGTLGRRRRKAFARRHDITTADFGHYRPRMYR